MRKPLVVVDASVALAWYLPDSDANLTYAIDVRDAQAGHRIISLVPDFWPAEIAYRLLKASRATPSPLVGSLAEATLFLDHFPQNIQFTPRNVSTIIELATRYHLQGWDALYFDVAVRSGAMLATLDGGLKTACRNFGVALWQADEGQAVIA